MSTVTSSPVPTLAQLWRPVLAMLIIITSANYLVQFPINEWLTWGAFTFPIAFLVTDLTNRAVGADAARRVAWIGFSIAVIMSLALAPWRIAVASGLAFITGQLLDIVAFNRLRALSWWKAPFFGSVVASVIDTGLFFFLAFAGTDLDWRTLAAGDLGVKWLMAVVLLAPYRLMLPSLQRWVPASRAQAKVSKHSSSRSRYAALTLASTKLVSKLFLASW